MPKKEMPKTIAPFSPDTKISNNDLLKHKALLVRLYRGKMSRNKLDKVLSEQLQDQMGVVDKQGLRVNKSLFTKESTKEYMQLLSEAGKYFYRTSTPWDDSGFRMLGIELYKDFTKKFKDFTRKFRSAVEAFIDGIEADIETMKSNLGQAFSRDDYNHLFLSNGQLDRDAIRENFTLELEFGTVADADDIRANLTDDDRAIISEHITQQNEKKFAASQKHIITMLHEHILKIHERLCESENVFRDTLISNLEDLCDLIPKMNIAGDPELNKLAADAKQKLCHWEPASLREVPSIRADVADEAEKLLDNMKGMV